MLPGVAKIPHSLNKVLIQPAMTVREAGLGAPLTLINKLCDFDSDLLSFNSFINLFTQKTGSVFKLSVFDKSFHPDCL